MSETTDKEIEEAVGKIDEQLKPFQAASVDYVMDQIYSKGQNKTLVADEVGLGKTIIAKGVIAKAVRDHKPKGRPFHVVYICSNQTLAYQNIAKLNPFGKSAKPVSRLVYLAYNQGDPDKNIPLTLSSLTPSTSFYLTRSVGTKHERSIIYGLLLKYTDYRSLKAQLRNLMKGTQRIDKKRWSDFVKGYENKKNTILKPGIQTELKKRMDSIPFDSKVFPRSVDFLGGREYKSFFNGLLALLKAQKGRSPESYLHFSYEIIRVLRLEIAKVCVNHLNADLFILDEFQRFNSLLDKDVTSEANELARVVLQNDDTRVLLLSATPFKPFTTQLEQLAGENHFGELKRIIQFLAGSNGDKIWQNFNKSQSEFFKYLRHPKLALNNRDNALAAKENFQTSFKQFISRNERMLLAKKQTDLVQSKSEGGIDVINDDIENFIALDRVVSAIPATNGRASRGISSVMEFSKSAPYPLSYLYGYKLREVIDARQEDKAFQKALFGHKSSWLSHDKIRQYKPIGVKKGVATYPNGKLRMLANECFKHNAEFLLWIPPSLPLYTPFGLYKDAQDFSKILVFSGWTMVPRAVSTLLSYEVERRTVGAEDLKMTQEKSKRKYFYKDSKRRRPSPLINFKLTSSKVTDKLSGMNPSLLIYPSPTLASLAKEVLYSSSENSYKQVKYELVERLKDVINRQIPSASLSNSDSIHSVPQWAIPALLDHYCDIDALGNIGRLVHSNTGTEKAVFSNLLKSLKDLLQEDTISISIDSLSIVAEVAISAPANAAYLALSDNFTDSNDLIIPSNKIASGFVSLFNKPESISAVRMKTSRSTDYWKQILEYCGAGNISSMLIEYTYLLKDGGGISNPKDAAESIASVSSVPSSTIDVDLLKGKNEIQKEKMRTHFATNFGDQRSESDATQSRMLSVRDTFNSPFRPFVLTSTSIGQEGLDFHTYCRKIFHWNLPHNAIDLEQREGRINRYKGLVIRNKVKNLITKDFNLIEPLWSQVFDQMEEICSEDRSGIEPFWYLEHGDSSIERFVPIHRLSKDKEKYDSLKRTLALYRLTFGQPRQEELVEALKSENLDPEEMNQLVESMILNLSPWKEQ